MLLLISIWASGLNGLVGYDGEDAFEPWPAVCSGLLEWPLLWGAMKAEALLLLSWEGALATTAKRQKDKLQTNTKHLDLSGSSALNWNSAAFAHFTYLFLDSSF